MSRLRLTKIIAPSAPSASKAELFYSSTDSKLAVIDESGNIAILGGLAIKDYRLIKVVNIFQGTTTYTPTTGTKALYVECVAGGSAGGGGATASSNCSLGSGGASGSYSAIWLTTVKSSYTVQVGAGGTGVSGSTGNPGTDTTFDSPSVCTAKAGGGGITLAAGTAAASIIGGAAAGTGQVGDITTLGGEGMTGFRASGSIGFSGQGAPGPFGGTSNSRSDNSAGVGIGGKGYGSGGSGGFTTGAAVVGGNGSNGLIRVWEFA